MKTITTKLLTILTAFAIMFTAVPGVTLESYAAVKAPTRITGVRSAGSGTNYAAIRWKKPSKSQLKKMSGIAVFRNGAVVGTVGKKTTAFTDYSVAPGTRYSYSVRAFKTYKQYYNSKKGKWVNKKPKKSQWKGKRKRTAYKYGKASAAVSIATKSVSHTESVATPQSSESPTGSSGGSTGGNAGSNTGGTTVDPYGYTGKVLSCTDYRGKTYEYKELNNGYWMSSVTNDITTKESATNNYNSPRCNRTIQGEFKDGGYTWYQTGGSNSATIKKNIKKSGNNFAVEMYNGDPSKLTFTTNYTTSKITLHGSDGNYESAPRTFLMKNGKRLVERYEDKVQTNSSNLTTKTAQFGHTNSYNNTSKGYPISWPDGTGFVSGTVTITAKYGDYTIGTTTLEVNPDANDAGLSPVRQDMLALCEEAVAFYKNGGSTDNWSYADYQNAKKSSLGEYNADMASIAHYISDTCAYGEKRGNISCFTCVVCSTILETYSIAHYGVYGYQYHSPNQPSGDRCFRRDDNKAYYLCAGY